MLLLQSCQHGGLHEYRKLTKETKMAKKQRILALHEDYMKYHFDGVETLRYSPLATDLTAREVNAQRTEADRDFH